MRESKICCKISICLTENLKFSRKCQILRENLNFFEIISIFLRKYQFFLRKSQFFWDNLNFFEKISIFFEKISNFRENFNFFEKISNLRENLNFFEKISNSWKSLTKSVFELSLQKTLIEKSQMSQNFRITKYISQSQPCFIISNFPGKKNLKKSRVSLQGEQKLGWLYLSSGVKYIIYIL